MTYLKEPQTTGVKKTYSLYFILIYSFPESPGVLLDTPLSPNRPTVKQNLRSKLYVDFYVFTVLEREHTLSLMLHTSSSKPFIRQQGRNGP